MDGIDHRLRERRPPVFRSAAHAVVWPAAGVSPLYCPPAHAAGFDASTHDVLTLAFVLLLLAALGAFGWAWNRKQRLGTQLRDARIQLRSLHDILDVWHWQTDAAHRLVVLRPPRRADGTDGDSGAEAWTPPASGASLFDHFRPAQEAAFRARLDVAAPLDDVDGSRVLPSGAQRPSRLRARACSDALGAFAGYVGTMRDRVDTEDRKSTPENLIPEKTSQEQTTPKETAREKAPPAAPAEAPAAAAEGGAAAPGTEAEQESFSYTVSHDLRAPIRVVEGFTKIVKEDYGRLLDRVGNDHLDRVLGAAARMNSMIDALLALSKLSSQPLARQPVNLSQLALWVIDDLRRQFPERAVQVTIEPGLQVMGDPTLLRVVLENLLGNAWKYTGKSAEPQIGFGRLSNDADSYAVHDNGAGFDMRYADRLFGAFQRLHSANDFPGTGIGLATVRRIIQRHGGSIWGEAQVGRGAQFHFTLPQRASGR